MKYLRKLFWLYYPWTKKLHNHPDMILLHINNPIFSLPFRFIILFVVCFTLSSGIAFAQFEEPEIEKMSNEDRQEFTREFSDIRWTGQGFSESVKEFDKIDTNEIRGRLQEAFGDPTQTLGDLVTKSNFRLAEAIQFEYWFTVNDSIPMMVLDVDGPFRRGLVYAGASKYVDLMPEIKRVLVNELLEADPADYEDYFYSPEREQWYIVRHEDGDYSTEEIDAPNDWSID